MASWGWPPLCSRPAIGTLAAWLLLTRVMEAPWTLPARGGAGDGRRVRRSLPWLAGYAGTWRALGAKAAPFLRNE